MTAHIRATNEMAWASSNRIV